MTAIIGKHLDVTFNNIINKYQDSDDRKSFQDDMNELTRMKISAGRSINENKPVSFRTVQQRRYAINRALKKMKFKWSFEYPKEDHLKYKELTNCSKREKQEYKISIQTINKIKSYEDEKEDNKRVVYLQYVTGRRISELVKPWDFEDDRILYVPNKRRKKGEAEVKESFIPLIPIDEVRALKDTIPIESVPVLTRRINRFLNTEFGEGFSTHKLRALFASKKVDSNTSGLSRGDIIAKELNHTTKMNVVCYDYLNVEKVPPGKVYCKECNKFISKKGLPKHLKTKKHLSNV